MRKSFHHGGTIFSPRWNNISAMMENDSSFISFCLIKACAILKEEGALEMIFSYHSNTPSFAIKRVSLFLLRRGIVCYCFSLYMFCLGFRRKGCRPAW